MKELILTFIGLAAIASIAYFLVYPMLQPKQAENLTNTTNVTCTKLIQYSGSLAEGGSFECPIEWDNKPVNYCFFVDATNKITRIDAGVVRGGLLAGNYVTEYYRCG
jgi:hypothetical protein